MLLEERPMEKEKAVLGIADRTAGEKGSDCAALGGLLGRTGRSSMAWSVLKGSR